MLRATAIVRAAAVKAADVADTVSLDHDGRHRRRVALTAEGGTAFLLDMERAVVLHHGDALRLEDGRLVQVRAAPEQLIEVRAADPHRLMRIAWHIGNRHVPAEITQDAIYIAFDPVIEQMLRGLGAKVARVERPFEPEGGAYSGHSHAADEGR